MTGCLSLVLAILSLEISIASAVLVYINYRRTRR